MQRRTLLIAAAAAALARRSAMAAEDAAAPIPTGFSERMVPLPLGSGGAPVGLRVLLHRPAEAGPHPLLVMHHGSTGRGNDPALFGQVQRFNGLAGAFARGGWLVAVPQRRGRGGSEGSYAEGLGPNGYSQDRAVTRAGFEHALADARAVTAWLLARPEADGSRVMLAGQSRGGILALGQAARHPPPGLRGTLNFVGGWLSEGWDAGTRINADLFRQAGAARAPALFLYGEDDPFYSLGFSRANFESFRAAGGAGRMESFTLPPGSTGGSGRANGHFLVGVPAAWMPSVGRFCAELGLPAPA